MEKKNTNMKKNLKLFNSVDMPVLGGSGRGVGVTNSFLDNQYKCTILLKDLKNIKTLSKGKKGVAVC